MANMRTPSNHNSGNDEASIWANIITYATLFTFLSLCVSAYSLRGHLSNFTAPQYQLYICRILLLVPIYAVTTWCSLIFPESSLWFSTFRDIYEAYAIYTFFSLLIAYLDGEKELGDWLELKGHIRHAWPMSLCLRSIKLGPQFLRRVKQGTLQFVFVKPFTALIGIILFYQNLYDEGNFSFKQGYIYLSIVNNVSITISLYSLVLFYIATEVRLEPYSPFVKFAAIKSVVFLLYWQSCAIEVISMLSFGVIKLSTATLYGDALVCFEMFLAAFVHHWAFPFSDFVKKDSDYSKFSRAREAEKNPLLPKIVKVLNVKDVIKDGKEVFLTKGRVDEELADQPTRMSPNKF